MSTFHRGGLYLCYNLLISDGIWASGNLVLEVQYCNLNSNFMYALT